MDRTGSRYTLFSESDIADNSIRLFVVEEREHPGKAIGKDCALDESALIVGVAYQRDLLKMVS